MAAENPRDPRFARYRLATLSAYLVLTIVFSGLIIWSVFSQVFFRPEPPAPAPGPALTIAQCSANARALFDELDSRRRAVSTEPDVSNADARWVDYRSDWLRRNKQLEAQCDLGEPSRAKLKAAFKHLGNLASVVTVNVGQFAGEVGPSLDATRASLDQAQ